jgi:hypothetical protein
MPIERIRGIHGGVVSRLPEAVADQIVRAICERLESATIVALDPIVLFVAPI